MKTDAGGMSDRVEDKGEGFKGARNGVHGSRTSTKELKGEQRKGEKSEGVESKDYRAVGARVEEEDLYGPKDADIGIKEQTDEDERRGWLKEKN